MRYRAYLILFALAALLIWFLVTSPSLMNRVRPMAIDLARVPLKVAAGSARGVYNLAAFQNRYEKKILMLEERIALLTRTSVRTQEVVAENQRLRSLLAFKARLASTGVAAEVIARSPWNLDSFLIIDKGSRDGIRPNMSVAKDDGLVGRVLEAGANTAKIILIDNPNSKIGVAVQRTREQGVLVGVGGGFCKIIYLSHDTDARPGDIICSGEGSSISPKGILIGKIARVLKSPHSLYASAIVRPSSNLFKVEEVLCIE